MCTSLTILGSTVGMVTHGQEKLTWSRQWESLLVLRGKSTNCLEDPKISSPLRCGRQFVKDDLDK
jgi:hypothetical protein